MSRVRRGPATAQLRIVLLDPAACGSCSGRQRVHQCVRYARHQQAVLSTGDPLVAARRFHLAARSHLVEEDRHGSVSADLVGQSHASGLHCGLTSGSAP